MRNNSQFIISTPYRNAIHFQFLAQFQNFLWLDFSLFLLFLHISAYSKNFQENYFQFKTFVFHSAFYKRNPIWEFCGKSCIQEDHRKYRLMKIVGLTSMISQFPSSRNNTRFTSHVWTTSCHENHKFLVLFESIASRNMCNSMADEKKYIRLEI